MFEMNDIGNYAKHARVWGLYGDPDQTEEYDYWCKYAEKFGKNILLPMCAVGNIGAYMANRGFNVTAFDITPEMIEQARERFGDIKNLIFFNADIRDFKFDIAPVDFCFYTDFGHLHTIDDVKKALACINRHMRKGGGLVLEEGLREPSEETEYYPAKRFDFGEVAPGVKLWKINTDKMHSDGKTGRWYCSQEVYIEENGVVEMFDHSFYMQSYFREEWIDALHDAGFEIKAEYSERDGQSWKLGDGFWMAEAIKL